MAIYGVAITKETTWHGQPEEFSNVYHYSLATNLDATLAGNLIDQIVAAEKTCHGSLVTFKEGRVWEAGGTPSENETILIKDVSGTGAMTSGTVIYKEAAIVARCETTRMTNTGKRIYLRKYYHTSAIVSVDNSMATGITALNAASKGPIQACFEGLRELTLTPGSILVTLCAPGGQQVSDSRPVTVLDHLHTRQFRR